MLNLFLLFTPFQRSSKFSIVFSSIANKLFISVNSVCGSDLQLYDKSARQPRRNSWLGTNEAQVHEEETKTASSFYLMHGCRREVRITHTLALSQFYTRRDSLSRCLNQYVAYKCSSSLHRSHDKVRHSHSRRVLSRYRSRLVQEISFYGGRASVKDIHKSRLPELLDISSLHSRRDVSSHSDAS